MTVGVRNDDTQHSKYSGNIELNAVGSILRSSWNDTLKENDHISDLLDSHIKRIRLLLGDIDYEVYVVDAVIDNIKTAGRKEVEKYLHTLEALAIGYVKLFGKEVACVMLHGVVSRSRSTKSLRKYYRNMNVTLNERINALNRRYDREKIKLQKMNSRLRLYQFGFFKFLKGNSIRKLRSRMERRSRRIEVIEDRILEYAFVQSRLHNVAYGFPEPAPNGGSADR